jgi:hypothetical protein
LVVSTAILFVLLDVLVVYLSPGVLSLYLFVHESPYLFSEVAEDFVSYFGYLALSFCHCCCGWELEIVWTGGYGLYMSVLRTSLAGST